MKFVNDSELMTKEEQEEIRQILEAADTLQDQLGIEETKQPEKEKPHTINVTKDVWVEKTVGTLVHLRKEPNVKSESLTTVRGGDIIKVSSSFSHPSFEKAKYKNKEGYIKKEYVRDL